jgi:hypothetical protein
MPSDNRPAGDAEARDPLNDLLLWALSGILNLAALIDMRNTYERIKDVLHHDGRLRFLMDGKTKSKKFLTRLGTIMASFPWIVDRGEGPRIGLDSNVFPKHMTRKLAYGLELALHYLEFLATGDIRRVIGRLKGHFNAAGKAGFLRPLARAFEDARGRWAGQRLEPSAFRSLMMFKIDFRLRGSRKGWRLFAVCGLTGEGQVKLLGIGHSAAPDNYHCWRLLFADLKARGLNKLPPASEGLDSDVAQGVRTVFPGWKPLEPGGDPIREAGSRPDEAQDEDQAERR